MKKKCTTCGTPTPYYKQVPEQVLQSHTSVFQDAAYAAAVVVKETFSIPPVGEDVQVCLHNVLNVVIGAYLAHPAYGYLKIVHWDSCEGKVGLLNEGISGTLPAGTTVPEYTGFITTLKPCCEDDSQLSVLPFVAEDFVIPGVGNSVTIAVTSTFGLIQGTNIRIGPYIYYLENINSSLEIVATNNGAGGTPGDTVEARDANGELQYLITQAVASACTVIGVPTVRLMGCDGSSETILEGEWEGQVPVLQDPLTEEVEFKLLDTTVRVCTSLTTAVNITPAIGTYVLEVDDASGFTIGDTLEVQSSSLRFEITNITGNDVDVTTVPNPPGVTTTLQAGEWVCLITCCENLQDQIDNIVGDLDSEYLRLDGTNEASLAQDTIGLDKLQYINTDRLLGRDTAGSGEVEELGVDNGIEFTGSGTIGIADNGVTTAKIADSNVTTAKIADSNVTTAKIADSNVTTAKIADGSLITDKYADGSITSAKIVDSNVTTAKIADSNVTTAKIADGSLITDKYADGSITSVKLTSDAASRSTLLGSFFSSGFVSGGSVPMVRNSGQFFMMPKAGVITHLTLQSSQIIGSGSVNATLYKNGISTGKFIQLSSGVAVYEELASPEVYAAGDLIGLQVSGTFTTSPSNINADVYGYFPA